MLLHHQNILFLFDTQNYGLKKTVIVQFGAKLTVRNSFTHMFWSKMNRSVCERSAVSAEEWNMRCASSPRCANKQERLEMLLFYRCVDEELLSGMREHKLSLHLC